jgi:hypothetical protein
VHMEHVLDFGCLVLDNLMPITPEICTSSHNFKKNTSKYGNFLISSYLELKIFIYVFATSVFLSERSLQLELVSAIPSKIYWCRFLPLRKNTIRMP